MAKLLDDSAVAQRVLEHADKGTTDLAGEVWREPVANYLSEARLKAEIEQVFRRTPTPFCPSAALAAPGMYVAREAAGVPILAVRGEDGKVRAFRNACRHRGMQLAHGAGTTKAFPCRYHGWTYGLDGSLRQVPHEHGFPGLDKSCNGLVPVSTREHLGLVFVTQDGPVLEDPALMGLGELAGPRHELHATSERVVEANWKVTLEGFIEGYHIRSTHKDTFYPYGFDNLNLIEPFGRHSRVTYPFRRIRKLADVPPGERRVEGLLTYVYHLFPNVVVTMLSRHTNIIVLEPLSTDRTLQVNYTLMDFGDGSAETREKALRDAEFVRNSGGAEDIAVITDIQRSIRSRANEVFTFGLFEGAISHFHRTLAAALAAPGAAAQ
jgi:phenylpropionate dioxygenase-like ring-hydroxylating dioxygenase large terminal subunit